MKEKKQGLESKKAGFAACLTLNRLPKAAAVNPCVDTREAPMRLKNE
jgi:hypothetical protein